MNRHASIGGAGADTLTGGTGVTSMIGGGGNDIFYVNNAADVVQQITVGGHGVIYSTVSFDLPANIDAIVLTGAGALTV